MLEGVVSRNTPHLKGGYLDFSHLTELENIYITEIYMRKQHKSSKIKKKKKKKNTKKKKKK